MLPAFSSCASDWNFFQTLPLGLSQLWKELAKRFGRRFGSSRGSFNTGLQKFRDGGTGKISGIRERMFVPLCPLSLLSCSNDLGRPLGIRAEGTASQNAASTP